MVQIYIIKMVKSPELKAICLNQQQYDELLEIVDGHNEKDYPEECCKLVTVETFSDAYIYKETVITYEQAVIKTSLALHVNITQLEVDIRNKLRKV